MNDTPESIEDSSDSLNWAAAATLMTLSVSLRCSRDFRYYRSQSPRRMTPQDMVAICERLQSSCFSLQNLMMSPDESTSLRPFLFILGRSVHDNLETLHRELLFYPADQIAPIIPLIDKERRFWRAYDQSDFYDDALVERLDHEILATLEEIESGITML